MLTEADAGLHPLWAAPRMTPPDSAANGMADSEPLPHTRFLLRLTSDSQGRASNWCRAGLQTSLSANLQLCRYKLVGSLLGSTSSLLTRYYCTWSYGNTYISLTIHLVRVPICRSVPPPSLTYCPQIRGQWYCSQGLDGPVPGNLHVQDRIRGRLGRSL